MIILIMYINPLAPLRGQRVGELPRPPPLPRPVTDGDAWAGS